MSIDNYFFIVLTLVVEILINEKNFLIIHIFSLHLKLLNVFRFYKPHYIVDCFRALKTRIHTLLTTLIML